MNEARTRECIECGFEYYGRRERCNACHMAEPVSDKPIPRPFRWLPRPFDAATFLMAGLLFLFVFVPIYNTVKAVVDALRELS